MQKTLKASATVILVILLLNSCKKYEDNPLINLNLKSKRVEGSYRLAGYYVNGTDSTQLKNEELTSLYGTPFEVHFFENDNSRIISGNFCQGDWEFADQKKMLRINISNSSASMIGPFATKDQLDWRITKLTDNHLHIKTEHMGMEYVVELHEE